MGSGVNYKVKIGWDENWIRCETYQNIFYDDEYIQVTNAIKW
jgi:hypothetical protein